MSYGSVKIDGKNLKKRDYSYESYTNEGRKLHSNRYSGAKKEKEEVTDKKQVTSNTLKKDNPYLKPYGIKTTNPKDLDLNKNNDVDPKKDPKIILLSIIVIVVGIIIGIMVLLLKMFD